MTQESLLIFVNIMVIKKNEYQIYSTKKWSSKKKEYHHHEHREDLLTVRKLSKD
jgi:hypothetical protein